MKEIVRKIFAALLLCLVLFKVSAFHTYEHVDSSEEDDSNCELCVLALTSQLSETLPIVFTEVERCLLLPDLKPLTFLPNDIAFTASLENYLFTRPPPSYI